MPDLRRFTLFECTTARDEDDVFPTTPISMNRLEFVTRTESPWHFVQVSRHLAIPDTARKRLRVHMLAVPRMRFLDNLARGLTPTLRCSYPGMAAAHLYLLWTNVQVLP